MQLVLWFPRSAKETEMKHKYIILKSEEKSEFVIQEFAELDKEMLSLLCEETYSIADLEAASQKGEETLISAIRTHNMYPPSPFAGQIARAIIAIIADQGSQSKELLFDDKELFAKPSGETDGEASDEINDDDQDSKTDVDDLLEDEIEENYEEDKKIIENLKGSRSNVDDEADIVSDT
jgi:hypothetical protein